LLFCIIIFSGVPALVDFAAMRDAVKNMGGDPMKVNPVVPVDLVIDHSVQVDVFGRYVTLIRETLYNVAFQRHTSGQLA